MQHTIIQKQSDIQLGWNYDIIKNNQKHKNMFETSLEKFKKKDRNIDSIKSTDVINDRDFNLPKVDRKSLCWIFNEWSQQNTEFTFVNNSHDITTTFINRNPLTKFSTIKMAESSFKVDKKRDFFLQATSKGRKLINNTLIVPQSEIILKTHTSTRDNFEKEE